MPGKAVDAAVVDVVAGAKTLDGSQLVTTFMNPIEAQTFISGMLGIVKNTATFVTPPPAPRPFHCLTVTKSERQSVVIRFGKAWLTTSWGCSFAEEHSADRAFTKKLAVCSASSTEI